MQDQLQVNRLWEAVRMTSHELVCEVDDSGIVSYVNDAALDMLGRSPAELIGRSILTFVHPDDVERLDGVVARCVRERTGWRHVRVRAVRPDGRALWLESSGIAHIGADDRLLGFTATTRRLDREDSRTAELSIVKERIERILEGGLVSTVWQPIYSLDHGHIVGAEALSRLTLDGVEYPPDQCFADAFAVGLGVELETLAVERALSRARAFPDDIYISVNLSPEAVATGGLAPLAPGGVIPPERLVLELTEHVSIDNYDTVVGTLSGLREAGVRLAVDDAGAGFASFRHVLRLKPDIIKLDQSITRGITENPAQRALAAALVLFALEVGSTSITAEGVETAEDLSTVSTLGMDAAQGYHLCMPVPAERIDWEKKISDSWSLGPDRR